MANYINPLDLIFISIVFIFSLIGYYNGFKNELKKLISLFITIIILKLSSSFLYDKFQSIEPFYIYIIVFIFFLFILKLLINFISSYFSILENFNKYKNILGAFTASCKSILLISLILHIFELTPIEDSLKNKIYNKANRLSVIFKACDNFKNLLIK